MADFSSLLNKFKQQTTSNPSSLNYEGRKRRNPNISHSSALQNNRGAQSTHGSCNEHHIVRNHHDNSHFKYPSTTPVEKVYIACPAFTETGGPEALHQLCHMINTGDYFIEGNHSGAKGCEPTKIDAGCSENTKMRAYMLYLREKSYNPARRDGNANVVEHIRSPSARPSKYDRYQAPSAITLPGLESSDGHIAEDNETKDGNITTPEYSSELVIWPECWTHLIDSLQPTQGDIASSHVKRKRYQIAIWWLSVDNNKGRFSLEQFKRRIDVLHLVQSAYARHYVMSNIERIHHSERSSNGERERDDDDRVLNLTEFIPHATNAYSSSGNFVKKNSNGRDLDIVYNPVKGIHFTDEIIRRAGGKRAKSMSCGSTVCSGIKFTPIGKGVNGRDRLTGEEVVELLKRAKVYIDFGPHPGMDRIPREAALAGCIVLTNREGAANFDEDVPLPSMFKIKNFDADEIFTILKDCCFNDAKYEEFKAMIEPYRNWIVNQHTQMRVCVDRFMERVTKDRMHLNSSEKASQPDDVF